MKWLRKRMVWIAAAVVGGFLLWLVGTAVSLQSMSRQGAGLLFGRKVSLTDFSKALQAVTHEAILTHGDRYRASVPQEDLERRAWERLLLLAEAKRLRIRVSDKEVVEELRRAPLFLEEGAFDRRSYETILRYSLGITPRIFEEEIRESLAISKLVQQGVEEQKVTDEEALGLFRKREESIRISFLRLPHENLAREVAECARGNPALITKVAKQLGLEVMASDFFKATSEVPSLGIAGAALSPVFQLNPAEVAGRPFKGSQEWLVVRLEEKRPADESGFPAQKEKLKEELLAQKRFRAYFTWYSGLVQRANLKKQP